MPNKDHCLVHLPKLKVDLTKYLDNQKFRFDYSFDENTSNDLVYKLEFILKFHNKRLSIDNKFYQFKSLININKMFKVCF